VAVEKRVENPAPPVIATTPPTPEPPRPSIITKPDWSRRPTSEDLARYYPERAERMQREGKATITCKVKANGTLEQCSIVSEDPADMGFGDATLKASRLFKMKPMSKDGNPVDGGTVSIPLVWKLPE
jgi:protein TonB